MNFNLSNDRSNNLEQMAVAMGTLSIEMKDVRNPVIYLRNVTDQIWDLRFVSATKHYEDVKNCLNSNPCTKDFGIYIKQY